MEDLKVRITRSFSKRSQDQSEITIGGLQPEELERLESAVGRSTHWVRVKDDRIEFSSVFNPLPDPIDDEEMLPFWRKPSSEEESSASFQSQLFDEERVEQAHFSPSFFISSLCGYGYTPEFYRNEARALESYGFICMRSRRDASGRYWEKWYLPGTWAARGDLEAALLDLNNSKEKAEAAVSFLCQRRSFGTLDLVSQRAAMVID